MTSRHLVDPALLPLLDTIPIFPADAEGVAAVRQMLAGVPLADPPEGVDRSEVVLPGLEGGPTVRALLYQPTAAAARKVILHFHGGGFIMGHPEMTDERNARLAAELGCAVLSIAYRLAPEHPHPAALDDALAAYRWIGSGLAPGGLADLPIVLLGDSAGGGLAAALSHRLLETGDPMPSYQALIYPMLDPRSGEEGSTAPHVGEFIWTKANNRYAWNAYLGETGAATGAAPALAEDVAGLPPTFMIVGALDLFLEENIEYARRLLRAAVPTELHVLPGAYHAFNAVRPSALDETMSYLLDRALRA